MSAITVHLSASQIRHVATEASVDRRTVRLVLAGEPLISKSRRRAHAFMKNAGMLEPPPDPNTFHVSKLEEAIDRYFTALRDWSAKRNTHAFDHILKEIPCRPQK